MLDTSNYNLMVAAGYEDSHLVYEKPATFKGKGKGKRKRLQPVPSQHNPLSSDLPLGVPAPLAEGTFGV